MKPAPGAPSEAIDHDAGSVHEWRVTQLKRLGVPAPLAEADADRVDWHTSATATWFRARTHRNQLGHRRRAPRPGSGRT